VNSLDEGGRQQLLKQGQYADGVFIEERRERECWACLKTGYRQSKTNQALFVLPNTTFFPTIRHRVPKTMWH
jgi:hypothetical protein